MLPIAPSLYYELRTRQKCPDRRPVRARRDEAPGAHANPSEAQFGYRSIDHAFRSKLIQHTLAYFIGAVVFGNLFTHKVYFIILAHFFDHCFPKRFSDLGPKPCIA